MLYHSLSAEVSGDDGREWVVTVEPPVHRPPPGEPTKFKCTVKRAYSREELAARNGEIETLTYTIPSMDGMFSAFHQAINLVP